MLSLRVLHLSYMPELNTIGPHALSLLNNLEQFHCTHNNKLKSIDPTAFTYELGNGSSGELWPPIVNVCVIIYISKISFIIMFMNVFFIVRFEL